MAAKTLPVDSELSDRRTWQTLVSDQRYRLFAAGNRKAVIAECVPMPKPASRVKHAGTGFDAQYGLDTEANGGLTNDPQKRLVLLTQVSRTFEATPIRMPGLGRRAGHWEASHCVRPMSQLQSYIDEQSGTLVFFLTRAKGPKQPDGAAGREPLEESALRIGKSLGLDDDNLEALRVASLVHEISRGTQPVAALGKLPTTGSMEGWEVEGLLCKFSGCRQVGAVALQSEHYCREHFIATCYERLDACREKLSERRPTEQRSDEMQAFLRECVEQASDLTRNPFSQDALERARLLDILHTASDLSRRVRRSPRCEKAFEVRVLCETPGRPWKEELRTLQVSQHGAMLECEHLVRPEDWLLVERLDNGKRTRARMAWRGPARGGHFTLGVELVDYENFWGLSWGDA